MRPDWDHPAISPSDGPSAHGDPMGIPAASERVLWKGRPSLPILARTAFHLHSFAFYFAALILAALAFGNVPSAMFLAGIGVFGAIVLWAMAWQSARTSLYILTDQRLILRIGMAVEARINIPLKHITAADLNLRGKKGHGDIAVKLGGERLLGYALLWPHVRPLQINHPQPMLRGVPDAENLAAMLAEACNAFNPIERSDTQASDGAEERTPRPALEGAPA